MKKLTAAVITLLFLSSAFLGFHAFQAMAVGRETHEDMTVKISGDTLVSDIRVTGTLTLDNTSGGTVTFRNCEINKLVLLRNETVDAPSIQMSDGCVVDEMELQDSASLYANGDVTVKKLIVAGMCDVQLDSDVEEVSVTTGAVLTCSGKLGLLTVSRTAQVNLIEDAYVEKAVFENEEPDQTQAEAQAASVLKVDTYAAVNALETTCLLIVNGTGSVNSVNAGGTGEVNVDVTITRQDGAKIDVHTEGSAAVNYMDEHLLPMIFDEMPSIKVRDTESVQLGVKDLLGLPLNPQYSVQSSDPGVIEASVSGGTLTLARRGEGYAFISVTASLAGYLPTHAGFLVNTNKEAPARVTSVPDEIPLVLGLGNICNKTLVAGDTIDISGITCNVHGAVISATSSNPDVADVSGVGGGAFTVTAKTKGIAAITVQATKAPEDDKRYSPAVQKFVVTVDDTSSGRIQLTMAAPSRDQLTKTYDGSTTVYLPGGALSGVKAGDVVRVEAIASYANADAGTDIPVRVSYHIYGLNADKYLAPKDVELSGVISRKPVGVSVKAVDRAYEAGNREVSLEASGLTGVISGDAVTLETKQAVGMMADDRAGEDKSVTVSGLRLAGADRNNYAYSAPRHVTVTITKCKQTALEISAESSCVFGETVSLAATGGSGTGAVRFAIVGGTGSGSIADRTLTVTKAGTIVLRATKEADGNYQAETSPAFTVTVAKAEQQDISIISASGITYGESYTAAAAGGSGTGIITFAVLPGGTGAASIDGGGSLHVTKAGAIVLQATKAEDDNYKSKESAPFTLTVGKAGQVAFTVSSAASTVFGQPYTVTTAGGSGSGQIRFSVQTGGTGVATVNETTGALTVTKAGTIVLKAEKAGDDNYFETASDLFTLTVNKAGQAAFAVSSSDEATYGGSYTATVSGGSGTGAVTFSVLAGGTGAASVDADTGALTITRAGTVILQAEKAGDDNYLVKTSIPFTLTIHKAEQAAFNIVSSAAMTYGGAYTAAATGGSGTGTVTYAIVLGGTGDGVINSATGVLTVSQAGEITLSASKAGDENYLPKVSPAFTLTVAKAPQAALSVTSAGSMLMGGAYTVTATGGTGAGAITFRVTGGTGEATVHPDTGVLTVTKAGTILLQADKAGTVNYLAQSSAVFTLTVNKNPQASVSVTSASSVTYGQAYTVTASGGSGTGGFSFAVVPGGTGAATVNSATGALTVTQAGTVLLKATRAGDGYYLDCTSATFTLTVGKATQAAVSVSSDSTVIIGTPYTVTATGGTGTGSLSYAVTGGGTGAATVNGATGVLTITKAGTVYLTATRAADANYLAQTSSVFTLTVQKGAQTISMSPSALSGAAGTTVALNAAAPGSGAITYEITGGTSTGSSVSAGGVLTLGTVGTVTVTATIAECSSYYTANSSVTVTSTATAPVLTAFTAARADSFDDNYRDLVTFTPTVYNPSGPDYPVTYTYAIVKTGVHGSIVHASASDSTARLAVGTYEITCTISNGVGSATRTATLEIPSTTASTGVAASGITGHDVTLTYNGNGCPVTYYNYVCNTAPTHNGSDNWYITGYTGVNCTGSSVTLASGTASAGITDARAISEASGIKSIVFTYHVDSSHGDSCLSSDVNYSVTVTVPYNDD